MSTVAIIIIILGFSIIITRGPLLVAPVMVRDFYLQLFDTDLKMRAMGLIFGGIGAICIWAVMGLPGTAATAIRWVAGFVLVLSLVSMIPFPAFSKNLGRRVWSAFGETTMRIMGAGAVLVGTLLVYYGLGL